MNKNKSKSKRSIKVTEEEFKKFIKDYPIILERDVYYVYDPPLVTYNDFSDNKIWPKSVVAYRQDYSLYDAPNEYYIKVEDLK